MIMFPLTLLAGELGECFSDMDSNTVDLSNVLITLDVTCVTLPPETELSKTTQRPCYTRMLSNMSQVKIAQWLVWRTIHIRGKKY